MNFCNIYGLKSTHTAIKPKKLSVLISSGDVYLAQTCETNLTAEQALGGTSEFLYNC